MNHKTVVPTNFKLSERQIADRIAKEYLELPEADLETIHEAAEAIVAINDILWARLDIELDEVIVTDVDPYDSYEEMRRDIEENNRMAVFSGGTHPTFYSHNPVICKTQNIRGRAIHDYFGHYKNDVDFSLSGEFAKWHHQKEYYPTHTHRLLFSEVVGQTALAYHLDGGFDDERFEQRSVLAPQSWIDLCYDNL